MTITQSTSRKRLVMLGTAGLMGGVASVIDVYRTHGLMDRWQIVFIKTHDDGGIAVKLFVAAFGFMRFAAMLFARQVACAHIHCSTGLSFWRKSFYILAAFTFGVPVILHLHGGNFDKFYESTLGVMGRRFARFLFVRSACVIVLATPWKRWIKTVCSNANIVVIHNPVIDMPSSVIPNTKKNAVILALGRLTKTKGTYDLLSAVSRIVSEVPDVQLMLGGDGEHDAVKRRARELGIEDRVHVLGWVTGTEKNVYLASAMVFAQPSYFEGLPVSILEAMSAGIPVITTPVGGIPDAVRNDQEGILVEPGDIAALSAALLRILTDESLRQRLGQSSRRTVNERFHANRVVPQVEALYAKLGLTPSTENLKQKTLNEGTKSCAESRAG